jgi:hypothetical protein
MKERRCRMSSRRKRRAREAQLQRADAILRSKVRLDGVGEDPAVRAFLTKMPAAKQAEVVELALALDRYLMGDASVMENPRYAEYINKMRARAVEIEDVERRWAEDPVKFNDEVWRDAEKRIATGDKKARMEAIAAKMYQDAREKAAADKATKQLRLDHEIEHGPKEDVECAGVMDNIMMNGVPTPRLMPVRVRIMNRYWDLKPGLNLNVPSVFAARYRQIKAVLDEQQARQVVLSGMGRTRDIEVEQDKISQQYGSRRSREHLSALLSADNAR